MFATEEAKAKHPTRAAAPDEEDAAPGAEPDGGDPVAPMTSEEAAAARDEIMALSSLIAAASGKILRLIGDVEARGNLGWETTPAQWLAWAAGMKPHTAKAHVALASRLGDCPKIAAALERGEISVDKADAISRIASPDTEDMLVDWARHGLAGQLHRVVAGYRRARRADGDAPDKDHLLRYLSYYFDDDGSFLLKGRLSAEDGAVVAKALDATLDAMWKRDRVGRDTSASAADAGDADAGDGDTATTTDDVADVSVTHGPERRADALVMMADTVLATGATTRASAERYQVVVHVDESSLAGREDGCCELDAGVGLAPETAARIACDASIVTLVERDGVPVSVGRKRRTVPPSLRRALQARDRGCRFPGCTHRRFTDAHHVVHWTKGGETGLDNLALLCRAHHRLVHEGAYEVHLGGGTISFVRPDGTVVDPHPPVGTIPEAIVDDSRRKWGLDPDEWAHWIDPLDLDLCVWLLYQEEKVRAGPESHVGGDAEELQPVR
jgi:Domain of unknown function (DUF222)/HNH endonuclease